MKPHLPDWPRLSTALGEVMAAVDCELDPSLDPKVQTQFLRFRMRTMDLVKAAARMQSKLLRADALLRRDEIQRGTES